MSTRTLVPLVLLAVLLAACGTPRKACRKAQRLTARAVYLCPEMLQARVDTVYLPGDTITDTTAWSAADVDSVLAACDSLRAAADAFALENLTATERTQADLQRARRHLATLAELRRHACRVEPLVITDPDYDLVVRQLPDGRLVHSVVLHPRKTPCPPCPAVQQGPVQVQGDGVSPWWRVAACALAVALLLVALAWRWTSGATPDPDNP